MPRVNLTKVTLADSDSEPASSHGDFEAAFLRSKRKARRRRDFIIALCQLVLLALVILAWQLASGRLADVDTISSPSRTWQFALKWMENGYLWNNAIVTIREVALGFLIGAVAGVFFGIVLGTSRVLGAIISPYANALYSLPKIALGPLLIIWLGIGFNLKVALAAMFVFFIIFYNTWTGVREVDADLVNVLRVFGAGRVTIVRKVVLPSSVMWVALGIRISFPHALMGAVLGEILASNAGLGFLINDSAAQFNVDGVFVGIISLVIIAGVFDLILMLLQGFISRRLGR